MKNDYDFIRDKFDNSGVNAPEKMDENFVLEKLGGENPKVVEIKKVKPYKKYSLVAACALFLTVAVAGTAVFRLSKTPASSAGTTITRDGKSAVYQFSDKGEVIDLVKRINENKPKPEYSLLDDVADSDTKYAVSYEKSSDAAGGANNHGKTYTQVEGVDEADVIKTDGRYIYVARDNDLVIYSAEGKNSKIIKKIKAVENSKLDEYISELYLNDNRLIVIYSNYRQVSDATSDEADSDYYESFRSETRADVYDCSDAKNLVKLDSFTQSGSYSNSRMIGSRLYLVSNKSDYENRKNPLPYVCCGTDDIRELDATDIYCVEEPSSADFVVVSEFDTADKNVETVTKSVLGSSGEIYCSSENLYVTGYTGGYRGLWLFDGAYIDSKTSKAYEDTGKTQIIKFSLKDGVELVSSAKVKGYINNQYSLDESGDTLRVATTSTDKKYRDENNLFVLDGQLNQLGSVRGFAKDESIKAVRYVGDTAYVITYEQTDPLFVIDLTNASAPTILGSVKISGFSSMLVPIDENTVLGIGYHTQEEDWNDEMEIEEGMKLALFDVSDKANPKVLDSKIFKNYYSNVQYNPKALLRNEERGSFTVPYDRDIISDNDDYDEEYGAITFSVKDGKISIDQQDKTDLEISRCTYIGDTIYMVSTYEDNIDCAQYK